MRDFDRRPDAFGARPAGTDDDGKTDCRASLREDGGGAMKKKTIREHAARLCGRNRLASISAHERNDFRDARPDRRARGLADAGITVPRHRVGLHRHRADRNGSVAPDPAPPGRERNSDGAGRKRIGLGIDRVSPGLHRRGSGISDVSLAIGVDKPAPRAAPAKPTFAIWLARAWCPLPISRCWPTST